MKKLLIAGSALLTLASAGASFAQPYGHGPREARERFEARQDRREARFERRQDRREYRRWARGQRLDRAYWNNRYYVNDYNRYGLRAPPRGYRWYNTGNQYVLAAAATGLIASVIAATR